MYDMQSVRVWRSKLASADVAAYHHKPEHKRRRRSQALGAVQTLMDGRAPRLNFLATANATASLDAMLALASNMREFHHVTRPTKILALVIVNWSCPSAIPRDQ
ncbi:MAG: hypothetical protein GY772_31910 [bacterium]|nr:hypothetical protein [bacterium]